MRHQLLALRPASTPPAGGLRSPERELKLLDHQQSSQRPEEGPSLAGAGEGPSCDSAGVPAVSVRSRELALGVSLLVAMPRCSGEGAGLPVSAIPHGHLRRSRVAEAAFARFVGIARATDPWRAIWGGRSPGARAHQSRGVRPRCAGRPRLH